MILGRLTAASLGVHGLVITVLVFGGLLFALVSFALAVVLVLRPTSMTALLTSLASGGVWVLYAAGGVFSSAASPRTEHLVAPGLAIAVASAAVVLASLVALLKATRATLHDRQ